MTRVLLVGANELIRSGNRYLLDSSGFDVVAECGSGEEATGAATELLPDVVLMDIDLDGLSGTEATRGILAAAPHCRVLLVTIDRDPAGVQRAFSAGATGVIPRDAAPAELLAAIPTVAAGQQYLHPSLGAALLREGSNFDRTLKGPGGELTTRELQMLREIAMGRTNMEAADRLFLSVRTVENHRARLMAKLGATSRAELVRLAIAAGLVEGLAPG